MPRASAPRPAATASSSCNPAKDKNKTPEACAKEIFSTLARRAYRRPVTNDDVAELMQYYADGVKRGWFRIRYPLRDHRHAGQPVLPVSRRARPRGVEAGREIRDHGSRTGFETFILPVELHSRRRIARCREQEQTERSGDSATNRSGACWPIRDRRLWRAISCSSGWICNGWTRSFPIRDVFPYASGRLDPRQDFRTELALFADSIFREDRSVVDLLRASHTYVNERLALQYGINDVKGDEFRRVELKDSARWGLLGKGAILMAAAYPNRTSPVLRGKFILSTSRASRPPTLHPTSPL